MLKLYFTCISDVINCVFDFVIHSQITVESGHCEQSGALRKQAIFWFKHVSNKYRQIRVPFQVSSMTTNFESLYRSLPLTSRTMQKYIQVDKLNGKIIWATFFIIVYCPLVSGIASCVGTVDKVMCHSGLAQACLSCLRAGTAWGFYTQSCCVQGTNALHHSYLLLCECASIQCILKTSLSRPRNNKI